MNPFPEEHDLLALFECEPTLADAKVPWCYNHLTFKTRRGSDDLTFEIEPGYETLKVRWSRHDVPLVSLDLNWVSGLEAELKPESEALVAHFRDRHILPLRVQLKPTISVSWSTDVQPA